MNESDRPAAPDSRDFLAPLFLGSYGENNDAFEKILVELLRDHVYWRRNFHPEDPPPISTLAASSPEYREFMARMRRELHHLTAALKRSVPFASPRYIGHMASDLLLPGLIAQMAALPYNPNNVVDEAAPVTVDLEIDAGLQLARMLGMPADESKRPCAFGHLTSGGSMANLVGLVTARESAGVQGDLIPRAVVYLTYWMGVDAAEIARGLAVSVRTVERELTTARRRLEVLLR